LLVGFAYAITHVAPKYLQEICMHARKLGSALVAITACALAAAFGPGCVTTVVGEDAGSRDAGARSDVIAAVDAAASNDTGAPDAAPLRTCAACQQALCQTEVSGCNMALADKSNVVTTAGDIYQDRTFCAAYLSEFNECAKKFTTQAAFDDCLKVPKAGYPAGVAPGNAVIKCVSTKCQPECVK
jgi:hypothetical protein